MNHLVVVPAQVCRITTIRIKTPWVGLSSTVLSASWRLNKHMHSIFHIDAFENLKRRESATVHLTLAEILHRKKEKRNTRYKLLQIFWTHPKTHHLDGALSLLLQMPCDSDAPMRTQNTRMSYSSTFNPEWRSKSSPWRSQHRPGYR